MQAEFRTIVYFFISKRIVLFFLSCHRVIYRDEDGDLVNLTNDKFAFSEMLRTAKVVDDRNFKKIFIQASEIDSPLPKKLKEFDGETPSCSGVSSSLQPKHLSFGSTSGHSHAQTTSTTALGASSLPKQSSPLDKQKLEMQDNLQVINAQIASAKLELDKLNKLYSKGCLALSDVRKRVCSNCHSQGHTKAKCTELPCTSISSCKIKEKHPEIKSKITELQRHIKTLENQYHEEDTHLKSFVAARERAGSSFFAVMRPRLKAQNIIKYGSGNRSRLDRDLLILQRAIKKIPEWDEIDDWKLLLIIQEYENSNVNIYTQSGKDQ